MTESVGSFPVLRSEFYSTDVADLMQSFLPFSHLHCKFYYLTRLFAPKHTLKGIGQLEWWESYLTETLVKKFRSRQQNSKTATLNSYLPVNF